MRVPFLPGHREDHLYVVPRNGASLEVLFDAVLFAEGLRLLLGHLTLLHEVDLAPNEVEEGLGGDVRADVTEPGVQIFEGVLLREVKA